MADAYTDAFLDPFKIKCDMGYREGEPDEGELEQRDYHGFDSLRFDMPSGMRVIKAYRPRINTAKPKKEGNKRNPRRTDSNHCAALPA